MPVLALGVDDKVVFEEIPFGNVVCPAAAFDFDIDRRPFFMAEAIVGERLVPLMLTETGLRQFDKVVDVVVFTGNPLDDRRSVSVGSRLRPRQRPV